MRISPSSAITKLQALLVIDLIIVAFAAVGYYRFQTLSEPTPTPPTPPPPKPAEFQIANLTIDRPEAGVGELVRISVEVSNVGEEAGSYSVNLTINDVIRETITIQLSGGENTTVEFTVTETSEGNYSVKIGSLTGTFKIVATPPPPPPPKPATFTLYNLNINPDEAWVDEPSVLISSKLLEFDAKPQYKQSRLHARVHRQGTMYKGPLPLLKESTPQISSYKKLYKTKNHI